VNKKLAVSNIAWNQQQEAEVLEALSQLEINALEVAPSVVWPNWQGASEEAAVQYRKQLEQRGFQIVAMQAILFAKPEATLFENNQINQKFVDHMRYVARLAHGLQAKAVVFGAPKNRRRGDLPLETAMQLAAQCFAELGSYYFEQGSCLCIEANPTQYECDFITNSFDAVQLVEMAQSKGLQLHLDSACMTLAGEDIPAAFANGKKHLRHFHASEPQLANFDQPTIDHRPIAQQLAAVEFPGFVSIEMRQTSTESIKNACNFVYSAYLKERDLCKLQ
jgi:sugar phosphate isomerase/epimerase